MHATQFLPVISVLATGVLAKPVPPPCEGDVAPPTESVGVVDPPTTSPEVPVTPPEETEIPVPEISEAPEVPDQDGSESLEKAILAVAPDSESCDGASFADECATAQQAAPYVKAAMEENGISDNNEIAALLSLMAFETGDFKFNRNHFPEPGRPGQGTRNLQMIDFNLPYALSFPELEDQALEIVGGNPDVDVESLTDDQKNQILELVLPDEYSWGSAAWYLINYCEPQVREGLAAGTQQGLEDYLVDCVGTEVTDERIEYWTSAIEAFQ